MQQTHQQPTFRVFIISALLTIALGSLVGWYGGGGTLWTFAVLVLLEITFSFDNAIINSRILGRMSAFWQQLFLTVGMVFAVFIVRFILPVAIIAFSSNTGLVHVIDVAFRQPATYSILLDHAAPIINAFGGTFLIMIGLNYFLDRQKDIHWLGHIERWLSRFGQYESFKILIMLAIALCLFFTVAPPYQATVLVASIIGTILHISLNLCEHYFSRRQSKAKQLAGASAFASFVYLNVLDASFSLDGVIGAFAISTNIVLIMIGLGAGALWVRSLTVYLVRAKTLGKYRYLEHGAHWAILVLGAIMLIKLYHINPPEWFAGSIGLLFIAIATMSSIIEQRRSTVNTHP